MCEDSCAENSKINEILDNFKIDESVLINEWFHRKTENSSESRFCEDMYGDHTYLNYLQSTVILFRGSDAYCGHCGEKVSKVYEKQGFAYGGGLEHVGWRCGKCIDSIKEMATIVAYGLLNNAIQHPEPYLKLKLMESASKFSFMKAFNSYVSKKPINSDFGQEMTFELINPCINYVQRCVYGEYQHDFISSKSVRYSSHNPETNFIAMVNKLYLELKSQEEALMSESLAQMQADFESLQGNVINESFRIE